MMMMMILRLLAASVADRQTHTERERETVKFDLTSSVQMSAGGCSRATTASEETQPGK